MPKENIVERFQRTEWPLFYAGEHTDSEGRTRIWTNDEVRGIAEAYDYSTGKSPAVIGHPKMEDPAWGWLGDVSYREDQEGVGWIFGKFRDVSPAFAQGVADKRYPERSISIFGPNSPGNPKPGQQYIKHVGWLGAAPPALHLGDPEFTAPEKLAAEFTALQDENVYSFSVEWKMESIGDIFRKLRDFIIEKFGREEADRSLPEWMIGSIQEKETSSYNANIKKEDIMPGTKKPEEMADENARLASENERLKAENASFKAAEEKTRKDSAQADAKSFAAEMVKTGRIDAKEKEDLVSFSIPLALEKETVMQFSAGKEKSMFDRFKEFMFSIPEGTAVDTSGGKTYTKKTTGVKDKAVEFAGMDDRAALDAEVRQYMAEHKEPSYKIALNAVIASKK